MNTTTISLRQKKNPSLNVTNITDDFVVVKAPSDMEEGFMFACQNNGIKFNVTVVSSAFVILKVGWVLVHLCLCTFFPVRQLNFVVVIYNKEIPS